MLDLDASLGIIREFLAQFKSLVPEGQYFKYNELWFRQLQTICFLECLSYYLKKEEIMTPAQLSKTIQSQFFHDVLFDFYAL